MSSQNGLTPEDLMEQFERYIEEAHRLKLAYQDRITLLVGLETEYITSLDLENLEKLMERFGTKIEYVVGSVHHVREIPIDFDLVTFQSCLETFHGETEHERMEGFLCAYFDAQHEVLERFRPEIVGHIDLCRLYNPRLVFSDYPRAKEKLERNIRLAAEYGALFEASAAPFRKGWDTAYPGKDVLEVGHQSKAQTGCISYCLYR
jgi:histidinol-phosphatase (PHP family)